MIVTPMDILQNYPIRKSKIHKARFRDDVQGYCESLGYPVAIEKGSMGVRNVVIGDPANAKYLITAHYDTCAHMFFPNFITPCNFWAFLIYQILLTGVMIGLPAIPGALVGYWTNSFDIGYLTWYILFWGVLALMMFGPANKQNANDNTSGVITLLEIAKSLPECHRDKVCFVLFDLEEAGLLGSAAYRKLHKQHTDQQVILNLDCIGDGNEIVMFPTKKLQKDHEKLRRIEKITQICGEKQLSLHKKGFAFCPSDQQNFPYAVGIMAFHKHEILGLYCSRIHTNRDTILEITNVNILRAAITTLICQN